MRAYEGGPDTSGPNLGKSYLAVKGQANIDPRIEGRIETYLTNWYSWGSAMGPLNCEHTLTAIFEHDAKQLAVFLLPLRNPRAHTQSSS
jgi:hypothetical protein